MAVWCLCPPFSPHCCGFVCVCSSSVSVWSVNKKKPLSTVKVAHGSFGDAGLEQPHWVASVAALRNSDTVASGASGCQSPLGCYTLTVCLFLSHM